MAREVCGSGMWCVDLKGFATTFNVCDKFIKFVLLPTLMVLLSELLIYLGPLQQIFKSKFSYEIQ